MARVAMGAMAAALCGVASATTGIMTDLVPYAADQELTMTVNGDAMSGVPEEYVSVRCQPAPPLRQSFAARDRVIWLRGGSWGTKISSSPDRQFRWRG
jgi:hypothetical protein